MKKISFWSFALAAVIIGGLIILLLKPVWALEGKSPLRIELSEIAHCHNYGLISENGQDHYRILSGNGSMNILTYIANALDSQNEVPNLAVVSNVYQELPDSWFIARNSDYMYWLIQGQFSAGKKGFVGQAFKKGNFVKELTTAYSVIKGHKIVIKKDRYSVPLHIEVTSDSVFICTNFKFFDAWNDARIEEYQSTEIFQTIADSLTARLDEKFTALEAAWLITNDNRSAWLQNSIKGGREAELFTGRVWGKADYTGDGTDNFLLEITGTRFCPSHLYCVEHLSRRIIFDFSVYNRISEVIPCDIDGDGAMETIVALTAPCSQITPDWFTMEPRFSIHKSYLLVLDSHGKVKKFGNKEAVWETGGNFSSNVTALLADKRLIFGTNSLQDKKLGTLRVIDFAHNLIDTLTVNYETAISLDTTREETVFFHKKSGKLIKTTLDESFQAQKSRSYETNSTFSLPENHHFTFGDKDFYLLSPLKILDENMNLLYQNWNICPANIQQVKNTLFFTSKCGDASNTLLKMNIYPNRKINFHYLTGWIIIILILTVFLLASSIFSLPRDFVEGSYAVLYDIMGLFYNWRIFGKSSLYTQPVLMSLSQKRFHEIMTDIAEDYQQILSKKLGFIKLQVFRLNIGNEMHIIQRIAHDIKNQMHLINLQMQETENGNFDEAERRSEIRKNIQSLYEKTAMLSDFSRINLLQTNDINVVELIDNVIMKFFAHPRFAEICWQPPEDELITSADENLLSAALINIIDNSLRYSAAGSQINILVSRSDKKIKITITNYVNEAPADSNKGSGIGIKATEKIILAHGGEFSLQIGEKKAEAIVYLPI